MGFQPFLALSASAGSGKTFALSVRYLALLFLEESPAAILAATFTNKAAAEMRQRVVQALRFLDREEFDAFRKKLAEQTELSPRELLERRDEVLRRFLRSENHIVTLDSFFVSVLRAGALEIGLEPDFVPKEEPGGDLEGALLQELEREGLLGVLVELAIQMQKRRVSGMMESLESLYRQDALLPDFPHGDGESPVELEAAIEELRASLHRRVEAAGASQAAVKNFAPASAAELSAKSLFDKTTLAEHRNYRKYLEKDPRIEEEYQALRHLLRRWLLARERAVLTRLGRLYGHYRNARIERARGRGELDFDDLGYFAYRLLYESLAKDMLYFRLDSRFRHILLDEFQDTSTLQFLLLKPLVDEIFAGEGQQERRSFFYVGDTKQSLYRFRGGVEELFDRVAALYNIPVEHLEVNYRSTRLPVESVNRWFDGVMPGYRPQRPHSKEEGYLEVRETQEPLEEALKVASDLIGAGVAPERIAFLVATNKEGSRLQELAADAGIETVLQTSSSLRTLPRIASLVAMAEHLYRGEALDAVPLLMRSGREVPAEHTWYRPEMPPAEILHRLIEAYGIFENDPNFLKLLEFAGGYETLPEFLEEFARSRIPVAAHTLRGAKILTIHGSKGLEFDYVIVADRSGRGGSDREALIPRYGEDLRIERFFYRIKGRERFDADYAGVLEERKAAAYKDRLNLLYVALTRAVKGLIVLRKREESLFEPLDMPMIRLGSITATPVAEEESVAFPESLSLGAYGRQEISEEEENDEGPDYGAILLGTAMHYALEMLDPYELSALPEALDALRNRYGALLGKAGIGSIEKRIRQLLEYGPFLRLLEGAELLREQPLSRGGKLRQIDLLVEREEERIVVDYKSSRKFASHHRDQVADYCETLTALDGKPTRGLLLYLTEEGVEMEWIGAGK